MPAKIDMARFAKFCKDNGFIFQSSEIYGGLNGFWDYGPLGAELKKNIKDAWWQDMVRNPPPGPDGQEIRMVGLDCSIIMNPRVWVASGHVGGFADAMVDCKTCKRRYRADKVFFSALAAEGQAPALVLACEADSPAEAAPLLNAEHERLAKKRKVPANLKASAPRSALEMGTATPLPCPAPGCEGTLTEPRQFNLMFETYVGAVRDEENK